MSVADAKGVGVVDSLGEAAGARDQCVAMEGVGWGGYGRLLRVRGERTRPRMVYLDGTVYLMSPSFRHEWICDRLGRLVDEVSVALGIPCQPAGQTTFRRGECRGGVEGDRTYYIANEPLVRGKDEIDLEVDPPPDLAIEVVHAHPADGAVEVYQRLGVPEVWVAEGGEVSILVLGPEGRYDPRGTSRAFPFLAANEVASLVHAPRDEGELAWARGMRRWVERELAPRVRDGREGGS